jgi:hypothetical protein
MADDARATAANTDPARILLKTVMFIPIPKSLFPLALLAYCDRRATMNDVGCRALAGRWELLHD